MRANLWNELLGSPRDLPSWTPGSFVAHWTAIATKNEAARPAARQGFIVRHDPAKFTGTAGPAILDTFASAFDPDIHPDEIVA